MGVALLGGEGTKLAGEYTDVGIVDVTVADIAGVVSIFLLADGARHHSERVEVRGTIEKERVPAGNALARLDFLGDRTELLWDEGLVHRKLTGRKVGQLITQSASSCKKKPVFPARRRDTGTLNANRVRKAQ